MRLKYFLTHMHLCGYHPDRDTDPITCIRFCYAFCHLFLINASILRSLQSWAHPCSNQQAGSRVLSFSLRITKLVRKGGIGVFAVCKQSQTLPSGEVELCPLSLMALTFPSAQREHLIEIIGLFFFFP